jgi:AcrR family transcriptional regulator
VTVRDIIARANVGRSTFYEHFEGKDDLLRRSITPLFDVLAGAISGDPQLARVEAVLSHFRDRRRLLRIMLTGPARPLLARFLAELIEDRLKMPPRGARFPEPLVPVPLIAAQLAGGQIALIESWLMKSPAYATPAVTGALIAASRAAASALLGRSAGA